MYGQIPPLDYKAPKPYKKYETNINRKIPNYMDEQRIGSFMAFVLAIAFIASIVLAFTYFNNDQQTKTITIIQSDTIPKIKSDTIQKGWYMGDELNTGLVGGLDCDLRTPY